MNTLQIIIYSVVGFILLSGLIFLMVLVENELEWRKLKKKWKEDAEKRKGQHNDCNHYASQESMSEPKKNLSNKNITKNSDKCNEKKLVPVAG